MSKKKKKCRDQGAHSQEPSDLLWSLAMSTELLAPFIDIPTRTPNLILLSPLKTQWLRIGPGMKCELFSQRSDFQRKILPDLLFLT